MNLLTTLNVPCCCCFCCLPTLMALACVGSPIFPLVVQQPASPSIWPVVQSLRRGLSTHPGVTMWCVCGCSWRDDVCCVYECYREGIVVMDVIWRRLCVIMIWGRVMYLLWVGQGQGAKGEAEKYLFRAANVWWRCAQNFVIASCGYIPRHHRCVYMAHVFLCLL